MLNSIKQICRTPVKLMVLVIAMAISSMILILGICLLFHTNSELNVLEESYTTIGTVEQKNNSISTSALWDAATQSYEIFQEPIYEEIIDESILDFEGAEYIEKPEKRPSYGAYLPDYSLSTDNSNYVPFWNLQLIIEFSPTVTCVPNEPVQVKIGKVLWGDTLGSDKLWLCDHHTENPETLEAGKTYIAALQYTSNTHEEYAVGTSIEWYPVRGPFSTQCNQDGSLVANNLDQKEGSSWEEVTDNFYESNRGKYWLNLAKSYEMLNDTVSVLPTNSLALLPTFHSKKSLIVSGREISEEEFKKGKRVCLVTKEFAELNNLQPGDMISLPLYYADHYNSSGNTIDYSLLNANGEIYPIFSQHEYEIVGLYQYQDMTDITTYSQTEMKLDQIIIPSASVKESDNNNIVSSGPMLQRTTSFQIPNGTSKDYMEKFAKIEKSSLLEITFDDNGYEKIKKEIDENRMVAILLCAFGILLVFLVVILLLYFFIIKQKKRIAIERAIGAKKEQCKLSMVGGVAIFVLLSTILGSILGGYLVNAGLQKETENNTKTYFSTKYSASQDSADQSEEVPQTSSNEIKIIMVAIPFVLTLIVVIVALGIINREFKTELIILLGEREN